MTLYLFQQIDFKKIEKINLLKSKSKKYIKILFLDFYILFFYILFFNLNSN